MWLMLRLNVDIVAQSMICSPLHHQVIFLPNPNQKANVWFQYHVLTTVVLIVLYIEDMLLTFIESYTE